MFVMSLVKSSGGLFCQGLTGDFNLKKYQKSA